MQVSDTGLVEIYLSKKQVDQQRLSPLWFHGVSCNALSIIDYLREAAGAPGAEYGLELAVYAPDGAIIGAYGDYETAARWHLGSVTFPRYQVGERAAFTALVEQIDRDFWNAAGKIGVQPLIIEF